MNLSSGKLIVKVSWGGVKESADGPSKIAADIDLQAVCFNDNGVAVDACYWNNERAAGGALVHGGDEKNDNGGEELIVMLDQLPVSTCTVSFTLSSFLPLLPLARVDDVVVTFEYVPTTGATQHMTLFPQFNETTCRPGLVSAVGHLARMGKQSFELHRYGDGVLTPGSTFVDSIPMLRELARLPAPSPSMATLICIPINLAKGETAAVFTPSVDTFRPVAGVPFDGALHAGVGWDVASRGAEATDVDLSAILLDNDYNIVHRVYWGELDGFNGAIKHHGDNETGEDSDGREGGDDEVIFVDLTRLPKHVHRVVFLVSNYGAASLASAKHLHFHLVNARTNQTLVRIEECQTRIDTPGMLTAMLVRAPNAAWNVVALNEGVAGDSVLAKVTTEAVIGVVRRAVVDSHLPESLRTTVGSLHHVPASSRPANAAATGRGKGKAESGRQQQDQAQVSRTNTKDNRPVNPTEFYTQAAVVVLIAVLLWYCLKYLRWA